MLQAAGGEGSISPDTIYSALKSTAIDVVSRFDLFGNVVAIPNGQGFDSFSGYGLVDAVAAIQFIRSGITINDVTQLEGNSGISNFVFTITALGSVGVPVAVSYSTAEGTASSSSDYNSTSGTVTFTPGGASSFKVTVQVIGDTAIEQDETFFVNLQAAKLARATVAGCRHHLERRQRIVDQRPDRGRGQQRHLQRRVHRDHRGSHPSIHLRGLWNQQRNGAGRRGFHPAGGYAGVRHKHPGREDHRADRWRHGERNDRVVLCHAGCAGLCAGLPRAWASAQSSTTICCPAFM